MVQINNKYQNYIIDIHLRNMVRVAFKKNFKLFDYRKERACIQNWFYFALRQFHSIQIRDHKYIFKGRNEIQDRRKVECQMYQKLYVIVHRSSFSCLSEV